MKHIIDNMQIILVHNSDERIRRFQELHGLDSSKSLLLIQTHPNEDNQMVITNNDFDIDPSLSGIASLIITYRGHHKPFPTKNRGYFAIEHDSIGRYNAR